MKVGFHPETQRPIWNKQFQFFGVVLRHSTISGGVPLGIAQSPQYFLRSRLGSSAGFQPAVSPISNRQFPGHQGRAKEHRRPAGWKPALLQLRIRRPASRRFHSLCVLVCTILMLAATDPDAAELTVFAAASLTDSLKEIALSYEKQSSDKVFFNFGASSLLARQIAEGAPADIFFAADEARMNDLEAKGLVLKETRKSRLSNSLVIIVALDTLVKIESADDLAEPT